KADLRRQQVGEVIHVDRAFVPCREDTRDCIVRVGLRRISPLGPRLYALWALAGVGRRSEYLRSLRRFDRFTGAPSGKKIRALLGSPSVDCASGAVDALVLARGAQPERASRAPLSSSARACASYCARSSSVAFRSSS